ncbi:Vacuolar protein sorting-associated protein ist1 [Coniosporium apollinis]|uniref:Vacuolar protein sorting-associated protein ist1 n=1 Tax=Coniosporium apollinis TaxID=61459 RepID=A0ABQ9NS32_9PEZI|nr:Vacuolar protein sorting-associated protein ist1 [Coniosporium apollinis]
MAPPSSLVSKLKVQLKLSISRLRMVQQKDSALAKQQRRAMAQLIEVCGITLPPKTTPKLSPRAHTLHNNPPAAPGTPKPVQRAPLANTPPRQQGKLESAKIRVENIIASDITTELHEILELYCELLLARSQLLDPPSSLSPSHPRDAQQQCDPGLEEAVRSLIYAAPRTEVKELHAVRALLVEKFGKEFALSSMEGVGVAERVLKKLKIEQPPPKLVEGYLREIAKAYGVPFPGDDEDEDGDGDGEEEDGDDNDDGGSGGQKVKALEAPLEAEELSKATPPRDLGPKSPLRVTPQSPTSENVAPRIRLPGPPDLKPGAGKLKKTTASTGERRQSKTEKEDDGPGGKIPDVDELAKRFAQLKR